MELSQCNAELSNYSHLIGQELTHNSGLHFILVLAITCQKHETETNPNNHFIEVAYKLNGIGDNGTTSIGFILSNYRL